MSQFDLIVIGSGTGLDVAVAAANYGLNVAIVEKGALGGTCLNRGCIPSKMLIHSADVVETINKANTFGIDIKGYQIDFPKIVKRVTDEVDGESKAIENSFKGDTNPKLIKGEAKFIGMKTLQVNTETYSANKILIACGSRPKIPDIPGLGGSGFITSDEALRLKALPESMTILGGGYIAAELSHFFGSLGTEISIVQRNKLLLPNEDVDVAEHFTNLMRQKCHVFSGHEAISVNRKGSAFEVMVENFENKERQLLLSDQLLVATGRVPNSELLEVSKTGVKTDDKGNVIVDEFLETNVQGIFALGDVVGRFPFKHAANLEAEYALQNLLVPEHRVPVDYLAMPHAIFTSPQIAGVGKTEQQLNKENADYFPAKWRYIDSGMGQAIDDQTGFVKFLIDRKTLNILGCHIIGTDASTLIHEAIVAMRCGTGSIMNIIGAVHVHPALSEVVKRAASNLPHQHEHEHDHDGGDESDHDHEHEHDESDHNHHNGEVDHDDHS